MFVWYFLFTTLSSASTLASTSRDWPRPQPWPQSPALGLGLGLVALALASLSASRVWPSLTSLNMAVKTRVHGDLRLWSANVPETDAFFSVCRGNKSWFGRVVDDRMHWWRTAGQLKSTCKMYNINNDFSCSSSLPVGSVQLLMKLHLTATEWHLPYGITLCYLPATWHK